MKKLQTIIRIISADRLFRNILKLENEVGRLEFFTLLLLRMTLLFLISRIIGNPGIIIIICAYFMFDLIKGRMQNMNAGKLLTILVTIFFTIYMYAGLNYINFLISRYYPLLLSVENLHYIEIMKIFNSSKLVLIDNLIFSIIGLLTFISLLFLLLKKGKPIDSPVLKGEDILNSKSLFWHFFSFKGASSRINYAYAQFFVQLILVGIFGIPIVILFLTSNFSLSAAALSINNLAGSYPVIFYIFLIIFTSFGIVSFLAINIKRFHHLGVKDVWVLLLFLFSILYIITHRDLLNTLVNGILGHKGPEYLMAFGYYIGNKVVFVASFFRMVYLIFVFYLALYPGKVER